MTHNVVDPTDIINKRKDCWNNAFYAYGYSYIFKYKADKLRLLRRLLTFVSIAVPVTVGIIATKFFTDSRIPVWLVTVASILSFIQVIISIWSTVAKWEDTYYELLQASQANTSLEQAWRILAKETPEVLKNNFEGLLEANTKQRQAEAKLKLSKKDEWRAMRAALFQYQRECAGCEKIPNSLRPGNCKGGVCGEAKKGQRHELEGRERATSLDESKSN